MILAGDIGGTKTKLGLFREGGGRLVCMKKETFLSREHTSIFSILTDFLRDGTIVDAACLGVAGPVEGGRVSATNLPWEFSEDEITSCTGARECTLINDLVALSLGTAGLSPSDLTALKGGTVEPNGVRAVIAAGTGLGQGYLVPVLETGAFRALPSEGGHADFSPRTDLETELWGHLKQKYGRVSTERVVSGNGMSAIYEFLRDERGMEPDPKIEETIDVSDPNPVIARRASEGGSPIARKTMDVFLSAYGAEAGDLALTLFATGGVFVGGGIARKILPLIRDGIFIDAFLDKGRFRPLMEKIPVYVVLNEDVEIIGAARCAAKM